MRERRLKRLVDRARPAQVGSASLFVLASAAATTAMLVWPGAPARAQCAIAGANQTCTNSGFLSGGAVGILDAATLTLTNTRTGTVTGANVGVAADTANVTNSGVITSTGANSQTIFANTVNGIDWHVVDRVSLFAGAEGTWMSDKSTTAVAKGGVRIGL